MKKKSTFGRGLLSYSPWLKRLLIMKMIAILLLVAGLTTSYAKSDAQTAKLNMKFNTGTVKDVIEEIERQSNLSFMYDNNVFKVDRQITINAENETVKSVVEKLISGQDLKYEMVNRYIIITSINESKEATQQQKAISGKVTDLTGATLPGVSVVVKGTTTGVITDMDGKYSLSKIPENATLVFSFVGMKSQEVKVGTQTSINMVLTEESIGIEEVVAIGYGTQKKVNLSGAIASVKMEELTAKRPVTSIANALVGNVPGLTITGNSGEPGSGYKMAIRGISSINGSSPLVLVDNIPMSINDINPEDIESVSVLKDASASAIYGARAAFGVILVTTKRSQKDKKSTVTYSTKYSLINPQSLRQNASPLENVQMWKDAAFPSVSGLDTDTFLGALKDYAVNPGNYPDGNALINGVRYPLAQNDIVKEMMENGTQKTHDLSISGGSQKSSYRVSLGYMDMDGVLHTNKDSYQRYNITSYMNNDINKWMSTELSILYSNGDKTDSNNAGITRGIWDLAVYTPTFYPLGYYNYNGEMRPFATPRNILDVAVPSTTKTSTATMTGKVILTPLEGLKITGEYSYSKLNSDAVNYTKIFNQFIDGLAYTPVASNVTNSTYTNNLTSTDNKVLNVYANYTKKINDHNLGFVAGINKEQYNYKYVSAQRLDMINQELPSLGQATGVTTADDNFIETALFGVFYRANYSYKDKLFLEATGRYDGSSKFPKDNRFGLFPSFSAGWRISEEPFLTNFKKTLSNLKLRASYGSIGNQNINPYTYLATMDSYQANWVVNNLKVTTLGTPGLVRSNFTWEKVTTINGGLDLGLFDSRFNSSFDVYKRETTGMLGPGADYPAVIGASAPQQNAADMKTNGWELEMSWRDKIGNWKYGLGFNLSDNISTITKYKNDTKILSAAYYEGMTLGEIWGYETDRLYQVDDFVEGTLKTTAAGLLTGGTLKPGIAKIKGSAPNPGDILYKNPDADGNIWASSNTVSDPGSKRIIGNNSYRYVFGINASVSYKGLGLSVLLQGVGKRDVWMSNVSIFPFPVDFYYSVSKEATNYWTPEHTDAFFGRPYASAKYNTGNNILPQSRFLLNASYLDVKSVVLSYDLPGSLLSKIKLKSASLFINGENLFSFNHYPVGMHPDSSDRGQGTSYPVMRMLTAGTSISF